MPSLSVSRFHSSSSAVALSGQGEVCLPAFLPFPSTARRDGRWVSLRLLLALIAFTASVLGLSGCGGGWGEFKPTITTQVQSQTVVVGATATFTVAATGTGPITYQWFENGTAIPGATGLTYTMTAQASDNGAGISAAATNAGGSSTSQGTLTVQVPPAITTQPANQTVAVGQTASFSVTATGTGPLSYQWFQNGAPISGATASTYTTPATAAAGTSTITVVVSNAIGNATSAPATLTVNAVPVLAFAPIATQTYGNAAFPVSATSASNGAVTYTVKSGPASLSGNVVTLTGVGTVVLSANQAASGTYEAAAATTNFLVNPTVPALQFASIPGVTVGTPFPVSASSASTGAITYSVISGPATIAGSNVTVTGQGTVVLGASQAASGNYAAATATTTLTAGAQMPNLVFAPVPSQSVGAAPFAVSATSASTGAVTYSVVSGPATISGNMVTVTGAGTVVLGASQAAAAGYNSATASTSFTVGTSSATLAFAPIAAQTYGNAPFTVSATSASSGAVTYSVVSGPATISGNTVTITGIGSVALAANQAASGSYSASTANTTFIVAAATPTLAFAPIAAQTAGEAPFTVSATSVSSGAVTYKVVSGPATISGSTVTVTGNGTVVLSATQAASGNYASATASVSFSVGAESATLAFAPIATQTYGNAPITVSATSASPGAVTYSVVSGPATISGNTVTMTGIGTVALAASQAAGGSYSAATANTTFTVAAATPTLAFAPIPAQTAGGAPFAVTASSASSGAVTYSVVSGPATISGNTVTTTGTGTVVLSATQAASGNYLSATASTSVTVGAQSATLTFAPITAQTYGNAPFAVSATSASPGAVSYSVVSGPATISGNTVTTTGTGTVVLSANQAATGSYAAATASTTFTVAAAIPSLAFAPIPAQTAGGVPFTVSATSASAGAVTYAVVSGPATISGSTVTVTGAGTVVLSATQAASGNYASATASAQFAVGTEAATLAFAPIAAQTYGNAPFNVIATSASPGPVVYAVTSGPATISGNTVTLTGVGNVTLTATQAASGNYAAAAPATTTFAVAAESSTLAFAPIPTHSFGDAPFTVSATSASSGAVTYSVVSGPATIVGNLVTLTGAGNVVLAANQAAAGNYAAATANATFTVEAGIPSPTLAFAPIGTHNYGDSPFTVSATSASNGAVTYNVISGPATISGNTVTVTGAGPVVLGASQAASGNYIAVSATTTFNVGAEAPNLTFAPIATQTYGNAPFSVSATSASNGAVTYAVVSGPATVSGSTVTTTGTGTVILSASQAASGSYAPATATTNFNVVAATPSLAFAPIAAHTYGDAPFTVSASSASTGAITYSVVSGPATISGSTVTITGNGPVVLSASQVATGDYTAATAQANFSVAPATSTLTFNAIPQHTYGDAAFTVTATSASPGPVVYAVQSGPVTISGNTVTITGTGTVTLTANQTASGNYAAAPQATTSFTVVPAKPSLVFAPIPSQTYGAPPFNVSASSASTGAITYSVVSGPATIVGQTVTITADGSIILGASQAADANYTATSTTTIVNVGVATPNLQFAPIAAQTYGNSPFTVSASSASSGAVTYGVQSGPATIAGNTVTITGAGTIVLTANQAQATGYGAASASTSVSVAIEAAKLAFAAIPTHTYGDAAFTVSATSASDGAVTYAVVSGPATISGNSVTVTGTGNVVLSASQAATANYAASSATTNFNVNAATPTLTFAAIPAHTYGDAPFTVSATSASSGPVVYAVQSGPATISGNTVTLTGIGTVVLTANQAASGNYATAAQASTSFAVNAATPNLTFAAIPAHTYGDAAFTVSATSASSGPVVYAVQSGPATISGNTVTLTGTGTVVLTANQAAFGNYAAAQQASISFPVNAATPTLTFASIPNHTYGDAPFTVSATSASSGPVVYAVQSGPATISGNTVTLTGAGTVVLTANQAAFGNYGAAAQVTTSFTVNQASDSISFQVANQTYSTTSFTVNATSNSAGAFSYTISSGPATVSGNNVTMTGVGTVNITVNQAASGNYAAGSASTTFTINAATPTLSFPAIPNHIYGDSPFNVTATSASSGPIVYGVQSGPATISGNTVTITGTGTVVLTANQAAYGNYNAAAQVTSSFTVGAATPTLSFATIANHTYGDAAFAVSATSASAGPVVYAVQSGPATISGNMVTVTGIGTVVLTANQAAYGNYAAAAQATTSFQVNAETSNLAFATIPNHNYGDPAFTVSATSASSGTVTYSVQSGPATISGNTVTVTGTGTVTLVANQAAAGNYGSATATTSFTVNPEAAPITFNVANQIYSTAPFTVSASSNSPGAFTYSYVSGPVTLSGNSVTMTGVGTVKLSVSQAASGNYAANTATATFTISQATPTITFSIPNQTYGATPVTLSASSPSTGAYTYTVVSGPATISNGVLTTTGVGTVKVSVSQAADPNYTAATASTTFTVNPASPSIVFNVSNQSFSTTPFQVNATSNSGGAFTYSVQSGPATISGNSVTMTGAGTVVLVASQAASGNYTAGTQSASFTVTAIAPTLSLSVANQTYGVAPFAVNASTNSAGVITYSVVSGPATVSGNTVTLTGLGTVQLQASQAASGGYTAATTTASFTVSGQAPTITFSVANQTYSATAFAVSASSNSPGAFSYVINSGPATVSGSNVTTTGIGTVSITVNQAASGTWASGSATTTFTIAPASPSINFSIPNQTYGNQSITLAATSNSTGAFTYTIVSGPATISPTGVLKLTGIGTVQVLATEAAAGDYTSGTATATFTVSAANPGIVFNVSNMVYTPTPFQVNATSSSAGAYTYSVQSGPATIVGNTVTLTAPGNVVLLASQAANGNYAAATQTASFTVSAITPSLTFTVPNHNYGDPAFQVNATSNSPGAITYSYVSGPATLTSPNTVSITGLGTVQLLATQAASGGYAAGTATATFTVGGQAPTINFSVANQTYSTTAFGVSATSNSPGAFSYVINSGPATVSGSNVTMTAVGTVSITANQAASGTWAAGSATTTFTIAAAAPAITFVVPNQTYGAAPFTVSASSPSSGAFTYAVASGPATVSGNTVTITGAGMVTLKATQAAAGNYSTNSATASFNVAQNVSISPITPANQTFAPGQITFNATAVGGDTDNLTWTATSGTFSGSVWTSPNTAGTYTITATSADDPSKSVTTTAVISAPVVTAQPISENVCVNSPISLSVTANYAASYQWYLIPSGSTSTTGTAISGATSSSYYVGSAQTTNAGTYTVVVTNPAGSVTSNIATVGVGSSITSNPNNVTIYPTQAATFTVGVTGDGPFSYQWYMIPTTSTNGTLISGATAVSYTLQNVSSSNNGQKFYVIVTDKCGTQMTSASGDLTVISGNAPPTISQQPSNVTTPVGGTPSFTVVATGTNLTYQWYQIPNGSAQGTKNAISGATSATYTLPTTATNTSNDQDQYYVVVTNSYGQAVSFPATLTVGNGIMISQQPQSQYINPGESATFTVVASSTAPLTYQWYEAAPGSSSFNAIAGATSPSYTFNSAAQTDSNTVFYVVVSNGGATKSVTSTSAAMFVTPLQGIPLCSQSWNEVGTTVPINPTTEPNGINSPNGVTYGKNCAWELTSSVQQQEGNIVWPTLISTGNVQLQFTIATSNPSSVPADGFTMLLGDPSLGATPTSKGATGQGMGAEGIPGFVLAFDDFENPGDPTIPYLGVGRGETALWENPYSYTNTTIPALAAQNTTVSHSYIVSIVQGYMTVSMDGNQVFSGQVSVPPVAYLYFTASTGSDWETTVVSNVQATVSVP